MIGDTSVNRVFPIIIIAITMASGGEPKKKGDVPALVKTDSAAMRASDQEPVAKEEDKAEFPKTLEDFKLAFNEKGQLRHVETGAVFEFRVKEDDHMYNQKRYEALGEIITEYVYTLLEKEGNLKRIELPDDAKDDEPQSFVFVSDDAMSNPDKLLILIHGSGVVRAGQWARRLIINDCLDSGTQLPFIKQAVKDGYGVLVLNTNLNTVRENNWDREIRRNGSPEEHALYVWEHIVMKAAAKRIAIIAHSYGGIVTVELASKKEEEFRERVFGIGFTDSVHSLQHQQVSQSLFTFLSERARNWVSSDEPLDTPMPAYIPDVPRVSAGHPKHEFTSWSSFKSIFTYLSELLDGASSDKTEL